MNDLRYVLAYSSGPRRACRIAGGLHCSATPSQSRKLVSPTAAGSTHTHTQTSSDTDRPTAVHRAALTGNQSTRTKRSQTNWPLPTHENLL